MLKSFLVPWPGPSRTLNCRGQSATFQWLPTTWGGLTPLQEVGVEAWRKSSAAALCSVSLGKVMGQRGQQGPKSSLQCGQEEAFQPP